MLRLDCSSDVCVLHTWRYLEFDSNKNSWNIFSKTDSHSSSVKQIIFVTHTTSLTHTCANLKCEWVNRYSSRTRKWMGLWWVGEGRVYRLGFFRPKCSRYKNDASKAVDLLWTQFGWMQFFALFKFWFERSVNLSHFTHNKSKSTCLRVQNVSLTSPNTQI